ncbi:MAG: penicillin-binding protein activator [Pseudomonadota bacterium]
MHTPAPAKTRRLYMMVLPLLLIFGCDSTTPYRPATSSNQAVSEASAQQAFQRGEYRRAGQVYTRLADGASSEQANEFNVKAAESFLAAGELQLTRERLSRISDPSEQLAAKATLVDARLDLADQSPRTAILKLARLQNIDEDIRPDVLEVQAKAQFMEGATATAVATLIDREVWLTNKDDVLENQKMIWDGLSTSPLEIELPDDRDPLIKGWLELGSIYWDQSRNPFELESQLIQWGINNPEHPASTGLLQELLGDYRRILEFPDRVALLLPLSDRLRNTGSAVRDGFFAGYFQHNTSHKRPNIKVYDVTQLGVIPAYDQARAEGAEFIVGPLTKRSVQDLLIVADGSVPVLALNYLSPDVSAPNGIFQYGLAPEDEAEQAANRVLADGLSQGIALVPNTAWGNRLINSFATALETQGGTLLAYQTYNPRERDYTVPITELLHLHESRQRMRNVAGLTGMKLEFEPRRRYDAQFIFVAADANRARLLRPQLKFHYANRLPVYATSSVYDDDEKANRELSGVMFPDTPWSLNTNGLARGIKQTIDRSWPPGSNRRGRLYAMGFDAYRLIPLITNSQEEQQTMIPGLTGNLELRNGRIFRHLTWAHFVGGIPELLPDPIPEEETLDTESATDLLNGFESSR